MEHKVQVHSNQLEKQFPEKLYYNGQQDENNLSNHSSLTNGNLRNFDASDKRDVNHEDAPDSTVDEYTAAGDLQSHSHLGNTMEDRLRMASKMGDLRSVKDLLSKGCRCKPDEEGQWPLHLAALFGHRDICETLVSYAASVNQPDSLGYTPIQLAAIHGHRDVVLFLVKSKCDVDSQDYRNRNSPAHEAALNGFSKTLEILVKSNANVFICNKAGFTPLHHAAQNGHNESSRVLIYGGSNPDIKNSFGDTALHTATRYGHAGVARILISAHCHINEQNRNGDTALHIAAALRRHKIGKLLLGAGADVTIINSHNETCIQVAKRKDFKELVSLINSQSKKDPEINVPYLSSNDNLNNRQMKTKVKMHTSKKKTKVKVNDKKCPQDFRTSNEVNGFFSRYRRTDGFMYYKDLAGNIKQGPAGFMPVCQCSRKGVEGNKTTSCDHTKLMNFIEESHQFLRDRIDYVHDQMRREVKAINSRVYEQMPVERDDCFSQLQSHLEKKLVDADKYIEKHSRQVGEGIRNGVEQNNHNVSLPKDDSGLYNRQIFHDIDPYMGRLYRTRSDETLSQSDYGMRKKKRRLFESRRNGFRELKLPTTVKVSGRREERENNKLRQDVNKNCLSDNENKVMLVNDTRQKECNPHVSSTKNLSDFNKSKHNQSTRLTELSSNDDALHDSNNSRFHYQLTPIKEIPQTNIEASSSQNFPVNQRINHNISRSCDILPDSSAKNDQVCNGSNKNHLKTSKIYPLSNYRHSSYLPGNFNYNSSSQQHISNYNNSSSQQHISNYNNSSSQQHISNYNNSSSQQQISNYKNSSSQQHISNYNNSSSQLHISNYNISSSQHLNSNQAPDSRIYDKFCSKTQGTCEPSHKPLYYSHQQTHQNMLTETGSNSRNIKSSPVYVSRLRNFDDYGFLQDYAHQSYKHIVSDIPITRDDVNNTNNNNKTVHQDRNSTINRSSALHHNNKFLLTRDARDKTISINDNFIIREDSGSNKSNPDSGYSCRTHEGQLTDRLTSPIISDLSVGSLSPSFISAKNQSFVMLKCPPVSTPNCSNNPEDSFFHNNSDEYGNFRTYVRFYSSLNSAYSDGTNFNALDFLQGTEV